MDRIATRRSESAGKKGIECAPETGDFAGGQLPCAAWATARCACAGVQRSWSFSSAARDVRRAAQVALRDHSEGAAHSGLRLRAHRGGAGGASSSAASRSSGAGRRRTDEIRQKEILESFIAQRVDGIAISCLNGDLLTDAIDRAVDGGHPGRHLGFRRTEEQAAGVLRRQRRRGRTRARRRPGRAARRQGRGRDHHLARRRQPAEAPRGRAGGAAANIPTSRSSRCSTSATTPCASPRSSPRPSQRYPDLDGWLSVGGWPVFVRNALDPVDPAPHQGRRLRHHPAGARSAARRQGAAARRPEVLRLGRGVGAPAEADRRRRAARREVYHYSGIDVVTRDNLDAYLEQWKRWEDAG